MSKPTQVKSCVCRLRAAYVGACPDTLIQISYLFVSFVSHVFSLFFKAFFHMFIHLCLCLICLFLNMLRLGFLCLFLVLMPHHSFICPCIKAIGTMLLKGK